MADWPGWQQDVLGLLHAPASAANVAFLSAWHACEESNCLNNPLNTTEDWPDATFCTGPGVKNYPTTSDGASATAVTLENGNYNGIVSDLRAGSFTAQQIVTRNLAEIIVWGTNQTCITRSVGAPVPAGIQGATGPPPARRVVNAPPGAAGPTTAQDANMTKAWHALGGAIKDTLQHRADLANQASRSYKRTVRKLTRR